MKREYSILVTFALFFIVLISTPILAVEPVLDEWSETYHMDNYTFKQIYSYPKYYSLNGDWFNFSEEWTAQGCLQNYDYCITGFPHRYDVHIKGRLNNKFVSYRVGTHKLDYRIRHIRDERGQELDLNRVSTVTKAGNQVIIHNITTNTDMIFSYYYDKVVKQIVIRQPYPVIVQGNLTFSFELQTNLNYNNNPRNVRETLNLTNTHGDTVISILAPETMNGIFENPLFDIYDQYIDIEIPYGEWADNWMPSDGSLIVDPTTKLNFSHVVEDGDYRRRFTGVPPFLYSKQASRDRLFLGMSGCVPDRNDTFRAYMDWNMTDQIPSGVTVTNITLLTIVEAVDDDSDNLTSSGMQFHGFNVSLPSDNEYDQLSGREYGVTEALTAIANYNVSMTQEAFNNLTERVVNNASENIWSFSLLNTAATDRGGGLGLPTCGVALDAIRTEIRSSEHSVQAHRPRLWITYGYSPRWFNRSVGPPSPQNFSGENEATFNITVEDQDTDQQTVILSLNGSNYSMSTTAGAGMVNKTYNVTIDNSTFTSVGNYSYYFYMNDTLGLENQTGTFTYVLAEAPIGVSDWELAVILGLLGMVKFMYFIVYRIKVIR